MLRSNQLSYITEAKDYTKSRLLPIALPMQRRKRH
jgi:hypothetical protein